MTTFNAFLSIIFLICFHRMPKHSYLSIRQIESNLEQAQLLYKYHQTLLPLNV